MVAAVGVQASQARVLAAGIYPSDGLQVSQALVQASEDSHGGDVQVSQALVLVAAIGRVADPKVRAWTFTLDGHDFYVLRCGQFETLVYDVSTKMWHVWGSGTDDLWRAYIGIGWFGARKAGSVFGSSIVVGDDGNGSLYFLNPEGVYDDDALVGSASPQTFERVLTAQYVQFPGYDSVPCFDVQLFGSAGEVNESNLTVELTYSDDRGHNYTSAGSQLLAADAYNVRMNWQSLGSMEAPGRLFKITDYGALKRIDGLMIDDGERDG